MQDTVFDDDYYIGLTAGQPFYLSLITGVPTLVSYLTLQYTPVFIGTLQAGATPLAFTPAVSGRYILQIDDMNAYEVSGGLGWATVDDATTNLTCGSYMASYKGPVPYLVNQFIYPTSDTVSIKPSLGNSFIDILGDGPKRPVVAGIDVSQVGGNNVLDSYANSSFLMGGSGQDEFYEDAFNLSQNSWTTVANFHAGDDFTAWDVDPVDFTLHILGDTQGVPGYTGLTGVYVPNNGGPAVGFTLAGITLANYKAGRVSLSYGLTQGSYPDTYADLHSNW